VPPTDTSKLPPPRSSVQTQWTDAYHVHLAHLPTIGGFFQIRNARGQISVPALNSVVNRDTTDYTFNVGLSPTSISAAIPSPSTAEFRRLSVAMQILLWR